MPRLSDELAFQIIAGFVFLALGLLSVLIDPQVFLLTAVAGLGAAVLGLLPLVASRHRSLLFGTAVLGVALAVLMPFGYAVLGMEWDALSPITVVLVSALSIIFFYYGVFLPLAYVHVSRDEEPPELTAPYPTVSIIVPAYNEADCIAASLRSLVATSYPGEKEIIVVDDGSTDDTYAIASEVDDDSVTVIRKENGGKYTALNAGLEVATGEIVVTVDADSVLEEDVVETVAATFQQDDSVGAIAGNLTVSNQDGFLTRLQQMEYVVGIQLFRRAYDAVDTVVVVPGAFGAYRRSVLDRVGGFEGDTLTEDRDATVKILKAGSVTRASDAVCHTEAPATWRDLYKQRLRWYRGTLQTLLKHRDVFRTSKYGYLSALAFPVELFGAVGVPIVGVAVVASIAAELLFGSVTLVLSLFAVFTVLQTLVAVLALRLGGDDPKLALYAPLFVLGYRQFLDAVLLKSLLDVVVGSDLEWTSPSRTGTLGASVESAGEQYGQAQD